MITITIYSIGDINYLETILNALAALFHTTSETRCYTVKNVVTGLIETKCYQHPVFTHVGKMLQVGFLVGLVLAIFRGILRGRLGLADFVIAVFLVFAMFFPKARVVIEDTYSGSVKAVENVPLGPAFIGGALSQIGYRVTDMFETAFSLPDMAPLTQDGFSDPLYVLVKVRKSLMQHLGQANSPVEGADVSKSLVNYIKDCTLTGVALNKKTMDNIERDPDVMNGIAWESNAFGTQLFLGGQPTEPTCREATSKLQNFVSGTWLPALRNKLAADLNVPPEQVEALIQRSLDALTQGTVQAQNFMLTAAILPFFEQALPAYHLDQMQSAAALMVQQSILQRNTQWAAQYSVFDRYVRPILTFIEGFVYAIGPFVAFALTLGPIAFRVVGLYLMISFWIQLWMPILAVINLYIQMSAQKQMMALASAQYQFPSIAGLMQSDWVLQDWLGVGGLLASSTPALAFMLLSGSAVAINHIVGRLEGGDSINERILAPDAVRPAPVVQTAPVHNYDPIHGGRLYGAEQALPKFDMGDLYQSQEAYSRQRSIEAMQSFGARVSKSVDQIFSTSAKAEDHDKLTRAIQHSHSSVDQYVHGVSNKISKELGINNQYQDLVTAGVSAGLSAALDPSAILDAFGGGQPGQAGRNAIRNAVLRALSVKAQAEGSYKSGYSEIEQKLEKIADAVADSFSDSSEVANELARRVVFDASQGINHVASTGWDAKDLQELSRQAQDVLRSSESWEQTRQLGERFGTSGAYDALTVSRKIAGDSDLLRELTRDLGALGLKQDAIELGRNLQQEYRLNEDAAYAAAGLMLMTGYSAPRGRTLSQEDRARAVSLGYGLIGQAMHGQGPGETKMPAPPDNVPRFGDVSGQVADVVKPPNAQEFAADFQKVAGEAQSRVNEAEGLSQAGPGVVEGSYQQGKGQLDKEGGDLRRQHEGSVLYPLHREEIEKFKHKNTLPRNIKNAEERIENAVDEVMQPWREIQDRAAKAAGEAAERLFGFGDDKQQR